MSHKVWYETSATVYSCGVDPSILGIFNLRHIVDAALYRTFFFSTRYIVVFSYDVDGTHYSGEFVSPSEWERGRIFPLKYDPKAPELNDRGNSSATQWIAVAIGVGMIAAIIAALMGLRLKLSGS